MKNKLVLLLFTISATMMASAAQKPDSSWSDSVLRSLTLEKRIAQLMMIRVYSDRDTSYNDSMTALITKFDPGGLCFFKGTPFGQATLTNKWQDSSATPLLIAIDAEWGLGMRIDSAFSFPRPMTLGAMDEDSLIYSMGKLVADGCKRLGVHINFAPVADINNNPKNPVINVRSFGENRIDVARKSVLYLKGMQDHGIMATAKHFPGHGDTDSDSHYTLPVIRHSRPRLDSVELYPFKELIREGVKGIMIAHLFIPSLDSAPNAASTLSAAIVTGLLRNELGFNGVIITDALDMQGVTKFFKPGEIELKALMAGNDILLLPQNPEAAIQTIRMAVDSGIIPASLIDQKCRKVLQLKYEMGLGARSPIDLNNLTRDLNPQAAMQLKTKIFTASATLVKNDINLIPMTGLERRKIAVVSLGDSLPTTFQKMIREYCQADCFSIGSPLQGKNNDSMVALLSAYDFLIIGLHQLSSFPTDSFGLRSKTLLFVDTLLSTNRVILTLFGNPYALDYIKKCRKAEAILVLYQDFPESESAAAQVIFGGISAGGRLPVSTAGFTAGTGEITEKSRLAFSGPEWLDLPPGFTASVDSIALEGIRARAYPGCQVLFAKDGHIFYRKSFGTPRYEDTAKVTFDQLYDIASVTKIAATTLGIMKLADEGELSLDDTLGKHLPLAIGSNKSGLTLREIMAHQAGLQPWIPFYEKTLDGQQLQPGIYRDVASNEFPLRVATGIFINRSYPDTIYHIILRSPLRALKDYKYSDLGFYLLKLVVEEKTGVSFEKFMDSCFYKPLGLRSICYNPHNGFEVQDLIPTEYDTVFRNQLIRGDVHDPGAAMLGGVAGHAGLFANADDLAVLMQMLLQNGSYGGKQYLGEKTIREFTRSQYPLKGNRRGAGFDKPLLIPAPHGPSCESASPLSFGHSGFTGTYLWADPANNLIFVFLSNRIYPSAVNQQISEMNIRTRIHQAMYDALEKNQIK